MALPVGVQRGIAGVAIAPALLALPIASAFLDTAPAAGFVAPAVGATGALALGVGVGALLPQIAGAGATRMQGMQLGAGLGLAAAATGYIALYALLGEH